MAGTTPTVKPAVLVVAVTTGLALLTGVSSSAQPSTPQAVTSGLADLAAMTFSCPQAGLNAAGREAATVPSQGTYQFSYFAIVTDAHHAAYEVHFKSNYVGEPVLKYCVTLYCQQGWDPRATNATVTPIARVPARGRMAGHGAACGVPPHVRSRSRRRPATSSPARPRSARRAP